MKKIILFFVTQLTFFAFAMDQENAHPKSASQQAVENYKAIFSSCDHTQFASAVAQVKDARDHYSFLKRNISRELIFNKEELRLLAIRNILSHAKPDTCNFIITKAEETLNTEHLLKLYCDKHIFLPELAKNFALFPILHQYKSHELDYKKLACTLATEPILNLDYLKIVLAACPALAQSDKLMRATLERYSTSIKPTFCSRYYTDIDLVIIKEKPEDAFAQMQLLILQRGLAHKPLNNLIHHYLIKELFYNPVPIPILLQNYADPNAIDCNGNTPCDAFIQAACLKYFTGRFVITDRIGGLKNIVEAGGGFAKPHKAQKKILKIHAYDQERRNLYPLIAAAHANTLGNLSKNTYLALLPKDLFLLIGNYLVLPR